MPSFVQTLQKLTRKFSNTLDQWGRVVDRSVWSNAQPERNPDPIDEGSSGERYFRISQNPYVKAALNYRDVSRLFVSAAGLEPDESGAYFPPQLIYTTPDKGEPEQLEALQYQYDEGFIGGFGAILKSLQEPAMTYGRAIGEIQWERTDKGVVAPFIWSRDPERYIINPPELRPGIYQKKTVFGYSTPGNLERMPDGKFMVVTFDSLFNNPYGNSLVRPIADMTETWNDIYDAWRMGLIKAGYGSWIGEYDASISGQDSSSVAARQQFLDQVKTIANGTASIFDARNAIRAEKLQMDAAAFVEFHTAYVQAVSVLMTGSSTALIEGKFGSFAKEESTTTRQKSDKEQADAMLMGAAFTYQFNRFWMHYNFANVDAIPQLQLIRPELIMPTTPQGQDTQDDLEKERIEVQAEENKDALVSEVADHGPKESGSVTEPKKGMVSLSELAEGDEEEEGTGPRQFDTFPDEEPEPPIYADVEESARQYLAELPVKNYNDVTPNESADVFTVKRLRSFEDALAIQQALKQEIINTIGAETEADAWNQYIMAAGQIFQALGLDLSGTLQSDLMISFRQARQSAYQAGIDALIESNPEGLTGIEYVTRDDGRVRHVHALWNGVVLAPNDPRLERIKPPGDFGCRCYLRPVYNNEKPLTSEKDIPAIFPGESYRGYV